MAEPAPAVELRQQEKYRFEATYPGMALGPYVVDEPKPLGMAAGPGPTRALATAVGHCMSSSLVYALARAHVPSSPIRTTVEVEVGRNEQGRLRVRKISLEIDARPLEKQDRERFTECVRLFEDFCTVSAAVREGIPIVTRVGPPPATPAA